mmetsp:Transcript_82682/g.164988  ORF Transcript_82682/g.164988 Transcript_82682/m.164988 type:complete len:81 (+) Transcript_82682:434-676(+)
MHRIVLLPSVKWGTYFGPCCPLMSLIGCHKRVRKFKADGWDECTAPTSLKPISTSDCKDVSDSIACTCLRTSAGVAVMYI